jgi:hypothetical protein
MIHAHAADADLPPGRCDAEERSALGTGQGPARDDCVSLSDDLFDLEVDVRECLPPLAPLLLEALSTHTEVRIIAAGVFGDEAVDRLLAPLIPDFLEKLPDERLVGFGGHDCSPVEKSGSRAGEPQCSRRLRLIGQSEASRNRPSPSRLPAS